MAKKKITWLEPLRGFPGFKNRRHGIIVKDTKEGIVIEYAESQWDPASCKCEIPCTRKGSTSWWLFCETKKPHKVIFTETLDRSQIEILRPLSMR